MSRFVNVLPSVVSWCDQQIRHELGEGWRLTKIVDVVSRSGSVYRITVTDSSAAERRYYLKRHSDSQDQAALADRYALLSSVAKELQKEPRITPFVVTAGDPVQRLLLTREVGGRPLVALHKELGRRCGFGAAAVIEAWRGAGILLATLHRRTLPSRPSTTRAAELGDYAARRFRLWGQADPPQARLMTTALDALSTLAAHSKAHPLALVPCHGDVTGLNICVASTVGLIDFDDFRYDLPAVDLSQAMLEVRHLSAVEHAVPLRAVARRAVRALLAGYGAGLPRGLEFWLPHLGNLSVVLLTLAQRRRAGSLSRILSELQYRQVIAELRQTITAIHDAKQKGSFWSRSSSETGDEGNP